MSYVFMEAVPPLQHDTFVKSHPHCNLLQSSHWAQVKSNWKHHLTGLADSAGNQVAAALVLVRELPMGQAMWYVPKGPVLDYADEVIRDQFLTQLQRFAKQQGATFLKIDPPIIRRRIAWQSDPGSPSEASIAQKAALEKLGFMHQGFSIDMDSTIQPRFSAITYRVDDFFMALSSRTRRIVRETEKKHVTIAREGQSGLSDFAFLISQTEENKAVQLRDQAYFQAIWDAFGEEQTHLYLARINVAEALEKTRAELAQAQKELSELPADATRKRPQFEKLVRSSEEQIEFLEERLAADGADQVVAGSLVVEYGSTAELLYAGRNTPYGRIHAQDAIHVLAMEQAFARGIESFSTGGVPGSLDDGLAMFKSRFLADFVETIGEFDYPIKPLAYRAFIAALNLRRKL